MKRGCCRYQTCMTDRINEVRHVRRKGIIDIIPAQCQVPPVKQFHPVSPTYINLLLQKRIVNIHERGIRIEIAHLVVGILSRNLHLPPFAHSVLKSTLYKSIPIPLPLRWGPYIADNGTRNTLVALVVVTLNIPLALGKIAKQPHLRTECVYVSVLAITRSIPRQTAIREIFLYRKWITTRSKCIFCIHIETDRLWKFLLIQYGWID